MTEMSLVEICYRVTNIQKVLTTTKQFSLKFNSHMKLITELINNLEDEEDENLLLYEEKIEKQADHYHQRIILTQAKDGRDVVKLDANKTVNGIKPNSGMVLHTQGHYQTSEGDLREMTKSGILGGYRRSETKSRPNRWDPHMKRGALSKSTRGRFKLRESGLKPVNVARSVDEHQVRMKRGRSLSVGEKKGVAGVNNSEFVNHFQRKKMHDEVESLRGSMTERFDVFAKENEFLRKIIKSGEENAKHLKDCVFKLIEVFKNKESEKQTNQTNHQRVEHIERIERVQVEPPRKDEEEKTVDIKINHSFLKKQASIETTNQQIASLKRENQRLKERIEKLIQERQEESKKKQRAELKADDMEMDLQKAQSQLKLLKREKQELEEEAEELRVKAKQWKKKYRDEADKGWSQEDLRQSSHTWRNERLIKDLEDEMRLKSRDLTNLRMDLDRLTQENASLKKSNEELKTQGRKAEGNLLKGKERDKDQSGQLERKDQMIFRLVEYVKELKTTIETLEEEVERMERELEKLSITVREYEFGKESPEKVKAIEKELKLKIMTVSKLERRIKHMTQMQNLEKKKMRSKQTSLNLQVKHLKERKSKLERKMVSLKQENRRHSQVMRTSSLRNHKPISVAVFESRKSNLESGGKHKRVKYSSEVRRRVFSTKKEADSQNVFRNDREAVKSYYRSNVATSRKGPEEYGSYTGAQSHPYLTEKLQQRYPQAPKHASVSPKIQLFKKSQSKTGGMSKSGYVYRVRNEEEQEEEEDQEQMVDSDKADDETLEKYVPVYMIGDQYIPVEEYNRLKMMGEIEDDSEDEEEEAEEDEHPNGEAEEESDYEEEYQNEAENYRKQIEEYEVNGYSGEDEEGEAEDEGNIALKKQIYHKVVKKAHY